MLRLGLEKFVAVLVVLCALERAASAADSQEQQLAQALFDDGRVLMDAKRFTEACPKFAESQRLDPGGGTLLNLAICHEHEGKLATAKNDFEQAVVVAVKDGRSDRERIARERIQAIESTIPRVTLSVSTAADIPGLELKLDGLVLGRAAWGVAAPVDPGPHRVEATAPGRASWSLAITVTAKQRKVVDVPVLGALSQLPPAVIDHAWVPPSAPSPNAPEPSNGAREQAVYEAPSDTPNPVFYTALTVSVLAGVASIGAGILALSARVDATKGCLPDRKYCRDDASAQLADRAATWAWTSTVTAGIAVTATVVMLIAPTRTRAPSLRGSASIERNGGSIGLVGTF